ncbi:MAG: hypothetical protein IJ566_03370 [Cardiobacteriaceae bacterium]|nr:hypothetical protein [Cardiobacteriaceae bacterium]
MFDLTACGGGNSPEPIYPEPEPVKPTLTGKYLDVKTGTTEALKENKEETVIVLSEKETISLGKVEDLPAYTKYGYAALVLPESGVITLVHQGNANKESNLPTGVVNYSGKAFVLKSDLPSV